MPSFARFCDVFVGFDFSSRKLHNLQNVAKEYEELKLKLWKQYEHNRDAYTNAKTEFVNKYTKEARMLYVNRY